MEPGRNPEWDAMEVCNLRCALTFAQNTVDRAYSLGDHETAEAWARHYHRTADRYKQLTGVDPRPAY